MLLLLSMSSCLTMLHWQATLVDVFLCCLQQIFLPVPVSSFGTVLGSSHSSSSSSWQTATCHSFTCHIVTTEMTSNGSKYTKKQKISRSPKRPPIRIIKHVELQVREHHKYGNYHISHELKCGVPSNQADFPPNKKNLPMKYQEKP